MTQSGLKFHQSGLRAVWLYANRRLACGMRSRQTHSSPWLPIILLAPTSWRKSFATKSGQVQWGGVWATPVLCVPLNARIPEIRQGRRLALWGKIKSAPQSQRKKSRQSFLCLMTGSGTQDNLAIWRRGLWGKLSENWKNISVGINIRF